MPARAPLLRAGTSVLRVVPARLARWVASGVGAACSVALRERRRIIEENLARLVPERPARERRRLARSTFRNLALCSVDLLRLPLLSRAELLALFDLGGLDQLDAALAEGRGALILTPHLGNYDLGGAWLAARGYPVSAVVEELSEVDHAEMSRLRAATGMRLLSQERDAREMLRVLARNEVLLIVADRVIGDGGAGGGLVVAFGSGSRPLPSGPAKLALRADTAVFIGHIRLDLGRGHHYVGSLDRFPIPEGASPAHLTQCIATALAERVRRYPDQWFVFQPDWRVPGV